MNIVFRGMKFLQNILLITFLSVCISSLWARPAYPGLQKITLADGSELMCRLVGDDMVTGLSAPTDAISTATMPGNGTS